VGGAVTIIKIRRESEWFVYVTEAAARCSFVCCLLAGIMRDWVPGVIGYYAARPLAFCSRALSSPSIRSSALLPRITITLFVGIMHSSPFSSA
jgi:hypothetical protein